MAILETDHIFMEISNIITYRYKDNIDIYESFNFKFTYNGQKLFNNITRTKFELVGGNIQNLIHMIDNVLKNNSEYGELEFCEPDFEFELKRFNYPDQISIDLATYEFTVWLMCGQWQSLYSSTGVGCKFLLSYDELEYFIDNLKFEFENRKIIDYENE